MVSAASLGSVTPTVRLLSKPIVYPLANLNGVADSPLSGPSRYFMASSPAAMGSGRDKKKKAAKRSHPEEVAKKVSGKEKTERKTQKSADKKERRKEREAQGGEDDIDAILASLALEDAKKSAVTVDADVPPPSPRCNASLTACEISPKRHELVLFGGEHYDGKKCRVYGDLYRYHIEKGVWSRVHSPGGPPARSAHVAGYWKGFVYVFGGEFTSPNQERFHHFKCLWRLDLSTNRWEELKLRGAPSPRSGHRAVMHKGRLVVFGGFFDNGKKVKYYGDTHVFDTQALTWTSVGEASGAGNAPSPRSAAGLAVHADTLLLYGGYSKSVAEDELDAERGTAHTDLWALPLSTLRWERLKRQGMPPGARAGFALTTHLKRAVLFGGVMDREVRRQAPPPQALHRACARAPSISMHLTLSANPNTNPNSAARPRAARCSSRSFTTSCTSCSSTRAAGSRWRSGAPR